MWHCLSPCLELKVPERPLRSQMQLLIDIRVICRWQSFPVSGGTTKRDLWKVDIDFRRIVEIVRENVQSDMGDDLGDFSIRESRRSNSLQVGISRQPFLRDDLMRKLQCSSIFR